MKFLTLLLLPLAMFGATPPTIVVPLQVLNPSVLKFGWNEDELLVSAQKRDHFLSTTNTGPEFTAFDQQLPGLLRRIVHTGRPIVTTIPLFSASDISSQAHQRMSGIYIVLGFAPQVDPQLTEGLPLLSTANKTLLDTEMQPKLPPVNKQTIQPRETKDKDVIDVDEVPIPSDDDPKAKLDLTPETVKHLNR